MQGSAIGYLLSAITKREDDAVGGAPLILMPMSIFAGFFANTNTYPVWIGWMQYLSPLRFGMEALLINEF